MNLLSRLSSPALQRLLFASLVSVPLGSACSSDDAAPEAPITFTVDIVALDGQKPSAAPLELHCDGTIAVEVKIQADPEDRPFLLLPSRACGASERCGYVRLEALSGSGELLASGAFATTTGVLVIPSGAREGLGLADVAEIRASLIRGVDDKPLLNPDQTEVTTSVKPSFQAPVDCTSADNGAGGAGGAPQTDAGGADGLGGAPAAGGSPAGEGGAGGAAPNAGGAPPNGAGAGGQG